ncbi:MAG TPA: 7TM diverse intracellular signaling domain-containing protein, partial [Leptospiraceae bacterium]|nr:7TM diverse intracellular signaling domain-containing protein [Leptospiraceae bacterium]
KISLPENLTKKLKDEQPFNSVTLRKKIPVEIAQIAESGSGIALNAGRVLDVSIYYMNGKYFGQSGSIDPYKTAAMRPFLREIPAGLIRPKDNYLQIVLYTNGDFPLQFMDELKIGRADLVFTDRNSSEIIAFIFLSVYMSAGIYHLLLFRKRSQDRYNLYFGLFCIVVSLYWFTSNTVTRDIFFHDRVFLHRKMEHIFLFFTSPLLLAFISHFLENRQIKLFRIFLAFSVLIVFLTAVSPLIVMRICMAVWQILSIIMAGYGIYMIIRQIRNRNEDAKYIIIGMILLAFGLVTDILSSRSIIHFPKISNYAFFVFVSGIVLLLADKFMKVTNGFEELTVQLEKKVEQRTQELSNTLSIVQKLKEQQDGDYYLTSLLLEPLSGNFIKGGSGNIQIEILVHQKKNFLFRKKSKEIGGDICISDSFSLSGESFIVFANGDAMGKSIQGAGGALVFGSVFRAVIERTKSMSGGPGFSPEIWLKNCFQEIQKVFVSFNGSMLISAIIGLVEERSGLVYYINAEHPYFILYRDGKSEFIEDRILTRKIGIEGLEGSLQVKLFQMGKGDALICGSDGKDDILLGVESGVRVINENERLILQTLNEAEGDLHKIESRLNEKGELTDDLSLLKITFFGIPVQYENPKYHVSNYNDSLESAESALFFYLEYIAENGENPNALKEISDIYIHQKDYAKASFYLDRLIQTAPENTSALYLNSFLKKKAGKLSEAAELGERHRIRNPFNVLNLVNLADIYRLTGNYERSKKMTERALLIEPENEKAKRLLNVQSQGEPTSI